MSIVNLHTQICKSTLSKDERAVKENKSRTCNFVIRLLLSRRKLFCKKVYTCLDLKPKIKKNRTFGDWSKFVLNVNHSPDCLDCFQTDLNINLTEYYDYFPAFPEPHRLGLFVEKQFTFRIEGSSLTEIIARIKKKTFIDKSVIDFLVTPFGFVLNIFLSDRIFSGKFRFITWVVPWFCFHSALICFSIN